MRNGITAIFFSFYLYFYTYSLNLKPDYAIISVFLCFFFSRGVNRRLIISGKKYFGKYKSAPLHMDLIILYTRLDGEDNGCASASRRRS